MIAACLGPLIILIRNNKFVLQHAGSCILGMPCCFLSGRTAYVMTATGAAGQGWSALLSLISPSLGLDRTASFPCCSRRGCGRYDSSFCGFFVAVAYGDAGTHNSALRAMEVLVQFHTLVRLRFCADNPDNQCVLISAGGLLTALETPGPR